MMYLEVAGDAVKLQFKCKKMVVCTVVCAVVVLAWWIERVDVYPWGNRQ